MDALGIHMNWNIPLLVLIAGIGVTAQLLLKYMLKAESDSPQIIMLYSSLFIFYLLMGSPLKTLSHLSFSTHMMQMGLLFFFVPLFLLLGLPNKLRKRLNSIPTAFPLTALIIFSALLFLYHMPQMMPFLFEHSSVHQLFILLLFLFSIVILIPMLAPEDKRKVNRYSLLSGILITPACLLLIANGLLDGTNGSPYLSQLAVKLCLPADQMDLLLPFKINTKIDQIAGGFLMMGLHKFSLMLAFHFGSREGRENEGVLRDLRLTFKMVKPSLRRME